MIFGNLKAEIIMNNYLWYNNDAPKIINPNDKDCPKIEYNNYNNKIDIYNLENNNELKGINAQNYKIIHSVSDSPNSSSEDCILIEDDDDDDETMLVSDSGQNKNIYIVNDEEKYSSLLENTIELSSATNNPSTTILPNNKIYNNNLIKFQISQKNNQPPPLYVPPQTTSLLTSNKFISEFQRDTILLQHIPNREIATSTTSLDKETISANQSLESNPFINNLSINYNEIDSGDAADITRTNENASKLANELIKRLQSSSDATKSIILNNTKRIRLKNINCIPPTKIHRIPNPRDVASVDSLNLEMCHFKPITTVPITPTTISNAVIIKIPVAKKIQLRKRKCDVFIGPKKGLMPVLFSTTTSERFSAFYLYNNTKNSLPLIEPCQQQIENANKLKNNTPIKPKIIIKDNQQKLQIITRKNTLKLQKITKNKFYVKNCKITLKRCKVPPKYIKEQLIKTNIPQSKRNLKSEINFSLINIGNVNNNKISKTTRKQMTKLIESTSKQIPKLLINSNNNNTNPVKRALRSSRQPINYCENIQESLTEKYSNITLPSNKLIDNSKRLISRSKIVVSEPYISKESSNTTETLSSNKIIDKKKTTNSSRIKKNQEKLDFEYAKRLQYKFLNECGPIQPIALRLRRKSLSSIDVINYNQKNNFDNIDGTISTYNKNNDNMNKKTGQNVVTSNKTASTITETVK